jgi:TetR/AcrR family transcriptional repressor of bet genes
MPKVGMPEIRKPQLINATMEAINAVGLHKASVAMISSYAGVSPAIINHYFGGKHGLLEATMRSVLQQLSHGVKIRLQETAPDDVFSRIKAIVSGNFDTRQVEPKVVKTWLAFWSLAMHDPALHRLQRVNEKRLLSHLLLELKQVLPTDRALIVAQSIAALIDGIWLRGALTPTGIDSDIAQRLITDYLEQQLPADVIARHKSGTDY